MAGLKHSSKPVLRSSSRPKRPRRSWPISPCRSANRIPAKSLQLFCGETCRTRRPGATCATRCRESRRPCRRPRARLRFDGASVSLDPSAVDADVARFERLVADSSPDALGQVAALYRGDLLAGLVLAERPFEEWLTAERQRLHELAIQGLGRLLTHQQKAGRNRREQRRVVPEEMHRDEPGEAGGQGRLDQRDGNAPPTTQSPRKVLAKAQPGDRHAVGTGRTPSRFRSCATNLFSGRSKPRSGLRLLNRR